MEEIHLLILWSKALNQKDKILSDLNEKFDVLEVSNVTWSLDKFSENLSRFYGENLPKNSGKEKHCGNDTFTCIIVRDNNPLYDLRKTSKGSKVVNTNLFDVKQLYREWTGGGHKIHATDDVNETKLQLALLFAKEYKNYLDLDIYTNESNYDNNLVGSNGWNSFEELFNILNLTSKYVILRNFDNLDEQLNSLHPDVDLLVENKQIISKIMNAYATTKKSYRVQYSVKISGKDINFDLRHVGDDYYCYSWERAILQQRVKYSYFYVPNKEMLFYSLLYHALIHKKHISVDYINQFMEMYPNIKMYTYIDINLLELLSEYMDKSHYVYTEPKDISVFFNNKLLENKVFIRMTSKRRLLYKGWRYLKFLKRFY